MSTDEEKITRLYQQTRQQGAPAHLDKAVLSAAHDGVQENTQLKANKANQKNSANSPFSGGWRTATSIAAVLIISIILVPLVKQEVSPVSSAKTPLQYDKQKTNDLDKKLRESLKAKKNSPERVLRLKQEITKKRNINSEKKQQGLTRSPTLNSINTFEASSSALSTADTPLQQTHRITTSLSSESRLTIEQWLKKIEYLIDSHDLKSARKELKAFAQQYPNQKISPAIKERLQ